MIKILLVILFPLCSFCQPTGRVIDSINRQPLPFATLRFFNHQGLLHSAVTDSNGRFSWTDTAIHFIEISAIGYQAGRFSIRPGDYLLQQLARTLAGVTVNTQRPAISIRPDGFLYDATRDVPIAGENTGDLLRKLPGIQVDPDGVPSMRGSTRIKVFIDGRPSEAYAATIADALRLIPAENIARIEIITQPSARYEGEGVDGVLQIFTRRPVSDGCSGNINGYLQNRALQLNANMAIRRKQWIITTDMGYYYLTNISWTTLTRTEAATGQLAQQLVRSNKFSNISTGIGITYLLDSLSTFSAGYRYGRGWDHIDTDISYFTASNSFKRSIDNPYLRYIHPVSWNYARKTKDKKGEFNFSGMWFDHHIENNYDLEQASYRETNFTTVWNKELGLESNYVYSGFEAGIKGAFRRYRNSSVFIPGANRSQKFLFPRDIYSIYISQTFNLRDLKIRAGLRYEQTVLTLGIADTSIRVPDYKNLLPNVLVSRNFNSHSLSAAYSRKIFRPWLNYLSPVISYIDSLNISYGNPYLEPAVSNNYDLTYSFLKSKWLISANFFWYQTLRSIEGVALLKTGGIVERTYQNIAQNSITGVSVQLSYRTTSLTINVNNNLRYISFGNRNGWVNNFTANATYKFTPSFSASAYVLLNGTRIDFQGSATGTRYYNFAANKIFAKGKYGLSIRLDNLFMPYQTITELSKTESFVITSNNKQIRRFFRFGFSYKFGKKEIRVPPVRTVSSEN
jgi:outer membrane receptor for ferrienterochelin and colicin